MLEKLLLKNTEHIVHKASSQVKEKVPFLILGTIAIMVGMRYNFYKDFDKGVPIIEGIEMINPENINKYPVESAVIKQAITELQHSSQTFMKIFSNIKSKVIIKIVSNESNSTNVASVEMFQPGLIVEFNANSNFATKKSEVVFVSSEKDGRNYIITPKHTPLNITKRTIIHELSHILDKQGSITNTIKVKLPHNSSIENRGTPNETEENAVKLEEEYLREINDPDISNSKRVYNLDSLINGSK